MRNALMSLMAAALTAITASPAGAGGDGKKVFIDEGCVTCHAVSAAGMALVESEEAKKELEEQKEEGAKEPPDLSGVGLIRDSGFLDKYLRKKTDIDGRKHKKRFKGSDEDRKALIEWLVTLKTQVKQQGK